MRTFVGRAIGKDVISSSGVPFTKSTCSESGLRSKNALIAWNAKHASINDASFALRSRESPRNERLPSEYD